MAPGITSGRRRGNVLLVAIVLVTLLSVMLAMVMRPIRTTSDRMKEQELIYRGEHLAAGIRRFYIDNGRFPFELEELIEGEKHYARKLYKDPMTEDGEWTLVYLMPTDRTAVKGLDVLAQTLFGSAIEREQETNSENIDEKDRAQRPQNSAFAVEGNQITGIRSKSEVEGLTSRDESRIYADWLFSALPQKKADKDKISGLIDQILRDQ